MKRILIFLTLSFAIFAAQAEDAVESPVKKMKAPKGVTLTPEQEKMLEEGNRSLETGYRLLMEKQDPAKAVEELRRAYVIANQLSILKEKAQMAGVAEGNEKGTPHDKIETEGGIERIVEISAATGIGAPPEVDNGLYKRKIEKKATEEAKKLETEQRQLTQQIANLSASGGGEKHEAPQNPQPQDPAQPQGDQAQPNKPDANSPQTPAQANADQNPQGKPDANAAKTPAQANADQNPQGKPDANAAKTPGQANADQNPQGKPDANAAKTPGQANADQNPQGKPDANAAKTPGQANADQNPQGKPDANAAKTPGQANADQNPQGKPDANAAKTPGQANADQNPQGKPDANAAKTPGNPQGQPDAKAQQGGADDLALRQEAVAMALHKIATELTPTGAGKGDPAAAKAAQAFRKAADAASETAQMLRRNQVDAAAAASKQAERAIGEAQAAAGAAENQNSAETLAAIQKQIDGVQNAQQRILGQTQQIHRNADGSTASEGVQKDRAAALAIEEGKLKPQIESVQNALKTLAENAEGGAAKNAAQNAAREETANALNALQQGRSRQAVVNATMKLANGEPATAATAMAQIQNALNAARQHVSAANNALAGNNAKLEQEYKQIQQVAAALRRLEQNAQSAGGDSPGNDTPPAKNGDRNEKDPKKTGEAEGTKPGTAPGQNAPKENTASTDPAGKPSEKDAGAVSASWGAVLNRAADQINADLKKLAPDLAAADAAGAKQIEDLAGKKAAFERDREGSLGHVRALLGAVEKVELALAHKVAGDDERKALRNYRKDEIPLPYRKAVASYYEELSKDQK